MGPVSAGNLAGLAWTLGTRLPGIGRLLADGTLTLAKAKLIAAVFEPLDEGEAARAEALILPEVAGKTYFQVERLAWRAALAVAPDVAERRRSAAERERARVTVFREESGAVGLSGRDLPGRAGPGRARQRGCPRAAVRGVRRVPRPDHQRPAGPGLPAPAQRGDRRRRDRVRPRRRRGTAGRRARRRRTGTQDPPAKRRPRSGAGDSEEHGDDDEPGDAEEPDGGGEDPGGGPGPRRGGDGGGRAGAATPRRGTGPGRRCPR